MRIITIIRKRYSKQRAENDQMKPKNRENEARNQVTRLEYGQHRAQNGETGAETGRIDTQATEQQAGEDREGKKMRHGRRAAWGSRGQAPHTDGQTQTQTGSRAEAEQGAERQEETEV